MAEYKLSYTAAEINEKLNKNNISSLNNTPHSDYEHVYRLTTPRTYNEKDINIIHLMLDYRGIYSNNWYENNLTAV